MRANSQEHVSACESATTPASQCWCRCGGRCHGRRLVVDSAGREAFEALPAGDPHRLQTQPERRQALTARRSLKRRERRERERLAHIEKVRSRNPALAAEMEDGWFNRARLRV